MNIGFVRFVPKKLYGGVAVVFHVIPPSSLVMIHAFQARCRPTKLGWQTGRRSKGKESESEKSTASQSPSWHRKTQLTPLTAPRPTENSARARACVVCVRCAGQQAGDKRSETGHKAGVWQCAPDCVDRFARGARFSPCRR